MPFVREQRVRTAQPSELVPVDLSNEFAKDLLFLTYGEWLCPVLPSAATLTKQNFARAIGNSGLSAAYNDSNVSLKLDKAPSGSSPAECTIIALARVVSNSADRTVISQADNSANPLFRIYCAVSGAWTFQIRDNSTATVSIAGSAPTNNKDTALVAVYRSGSAEKSFWQDGTKKNTATTAGGAITLTRASVGQLYRNTEAQYFSGHIPIAGIIGRALSDDEVRRLSANFWQLLDAEDVWVWVPESGASNTLTGATSTQAGSVSAGAITQAQALAAQTSTQAATSSAASIAQVQALLASSSLSAGTSSAAAIFLGAVTTLSGATSLQAASSSAAAITQRHAIVCAPSVQDSIAAASAIVQVHVLAPAGCVQAATTSGGNLNAALAEWTDGFCILGNRSFAVSNDRWPWSIETGRRSL